MSTGPPMVTVPTVAGDTVTEADGRPHRRPASPSARSTARPGGQVFTSVPLAGQTAKKGSAVTLYTQ